MKKTVYLATKIIKEAVYPCRTKAICTIHELATGKALADFASDPHWAEKQALRHIEENGWNNVSYDPATKTVTRIVEVNVEELVGGSATSIRKLFAKKLGGTMHKRLTALQYTMESCDELSQSVSFIVTATLVEKDGNNMSK